MGLGFRVWGYMVRGLGSFWCSVSGVKEQGSWLLDISGFYTPQLGLLEVSTLLTTCLQCTP